MKLNRFCCAIAALIAAGIAQAGHELENRDLALGERLYAEQCAACHGTNLEGEPNWSQPNADGTFPAPPHDETGHTWHHDNGVLFTYTALGGQGAAEQWGITGFVSGMPGFGETLEDDEIWAILAYIRSTWSEDIQALQASRNPPHD